MAQRCLTEGIDLPLTFSNSEVGDLYVHMKYSSSGGLGGCAPPILEGYD